MNRKAFLISLLGAFGLSVSSIVLSSITLGVVGQDDVSKNCYSITFGDLAYSNCRTAFSGGDISSAPFDYSFPALSGGTYSTNRTYRQDRGYALKFSSLYETGYFEVSFSSSVVSDVYLFGYGYISESGFHDTEPGIQVTTSANTTGVSSYVISDPQFDYTGDTTVDMGMDLEAYEAPYIYRFSGLDNGSGDASTWMRISALPDKDNSVYASRFYLAKITFTVTESQPSSSSSSSASSSSSSYSEPDLPTYYDGIDWSLTGAELKNALHDTISSNTKTLSYNDLLTAYQTTDVVDGYILDMYSNQKYAIDDNGASADQEGEGYNREHIVPQSLFEEKLPMRTDLFHVYPTDIYVNKCRSNYVHAELDSVSFTSTNGTAVGYSSAPGYSVQACEPADEYKGDIARSYFYMVTRYQDVISGWRSYAMFSKDSFPSLSQWALETLLKWHDQDPVSQREIDRNNAVYALQNNRNPFIDCSDWAHMVFDGAY